MTQEKATTKGQLLKRPPVVVILGHVDHGKSTLLDYIRKSNIVQGEAGGITQHVGAYEIEHKTTEGEDEKITFIDTPGHAAFTQMRRRGAHIADLAVLIISAEDGVKAQTIEAIEAITRAQIPYVVAINKIDRPNADVNKAKQTLAENNIYVEGWGGQIPVVEISAKEGTNVDDLLEIILLTAELEELTTNPEAPAEGYVIESHRDPKSGIYATLVIKDGTLHSGECLVVEGEVAQIRTLEDQLGKKIEKAQASTPVKVTGFSIIPNVGSEIKNCVSKKEAEEISKIQKKELERKIKRERNSEGKKVIIPFVLKADTYGTLEAAEDELYKLETEEIGFKIIQTGVGTITEADIKALGRCETKPIVIGFNVKVDRAAKDTAEVFGYDLQTFDVIYHATEYIESEMKNRLVEATKDEDKITGEAKILATFSQTNKKQVVGGEVISGTVRKGDSVKILRRDEEIGTGKISGMQQQKADTDSVSEGNKFGMEVESKFEIAKDDVLQSIQK